MTLTSSALSARRLTRSRLRWLPRAASAAVAGLLLVAPQLARSDDLAAQQIVDRVLEKNAFGFQDAIARVTLVLGSKSSSDRVRQIEIQSVKREGLAKSLVRFHAPADVAGTGFLVLENKDRDDDQYLYLPAIGKIKRIAGSQRNQRFMGTDLTYGDLESRNLRQGVSKRLPDSKVGSNETFVLETLPGETSDSDYGKTITWIHKSSFVPLKVEFYDKELKLLKTVNVKRLEKKNDQWVVMESVIENVQEETKTTMKINQLDLDAKLPDDQFTPNSLKQG